MPGKKLDLILEGTENLNTIIQLPIAMAPQMHAAYLLAQSETEFRRLIMESSIPMVIFRGMNHIIEIANTAMFQTMWYKKKKSVLGKTLLEAFPEMQEQKFPDLLDAVFLSGKIKKEKESVVYIRNEGTNYKVYFNFECTPLFAIDGSTSGIMVTINDVTQMVEARKKMEDAEERARLAIEVAEIATWELNLQTHENIHSPSLAVTFGHDRSVKLSYIQILNQIEPDDLVKIVEIAFEDAMRTGFYKYETRIVKLNGNIAWIRSHGKIFFNENGEPFKMIGTIIDITIEKQRNEILIASEHKFRLLADSMPQHIWTADPLGNLNYFNQSVFDYTGLDHQSINTLGWLNIIHPDERMDYNKLWKQAIVIGNDFLFEYRFRKTDGEYRWHFCRAIPQKDAPGIVQMWVGTSTDIENQKAFTNELEIQVKERTTELLDKNSALVQMNIELESFAYVSSHDLQEPLRKIQMFISRLYDTEQAGFSDKAKEYFSRIHISANRMQILIKDLLTYSRTNEAEKIFVTANLDDLVRNVIIDFKEIIEETHAVIDIDGLNDAKIIPFQFRQLFHNLLTNALKFTKSGIAPHIIIKGRVVTESMIDGKTGHPEKKYCHISISDNGIGFDKDYKNQIFEVFKRLHNKNDYSGTGIGLAIVKKIIENHGGIITATGVKDEGARFDFYIPQI